MDFVLTLITRARQRLLYNELLAQGTVAASAALAALIILLILGTEILDWYWLALIPAAAVAVAIYRVRKRLPSLYVSAQIVDRRLNLADALSTAVFFAGANTGEPEMRRSQREQAERAAAGADVRRAIPYRLPRAAYGLAGLAVVASSLFALRYGLTRRLDLNEPMARILQQALGLDAPQNAATPRKNLALPDPSREDGDSPLAADEPANDPGLQPGDPLDENSDQQTAAKENAKNSKDADAQNGSQDGEQSQGDPRASDQQNAANQPNASKDDQNQQPGGQDPNGSSNSSSLLSKMKQAVQNLLSSMKQQPAGSNSQQSQQNQTAQNSNQKGRQNAGKQGKKGEKASGQAGGEEQDPDLSSESQQAENTPGKGDDAQPSNKQPGGGIGSRDGSKDVRQAEQLAAMGKLTQIIGKRSANLSGEATVEVQSSVQQLRTAYSDRDAQHAEAGSEIGRDEIPAALENYVQQYFEQVRKESPAKK